MKGLEGTTWNSSRGTVGIKENSNGFDENILAEVPFLKQCELSENTSWY